MWFSPIPLLTALAVSGCTEVAALLLRAAPSPVAVGLAGMAMIGTAGVAMGQEGSVRGLASKIGDDSVHRQLAIPEECAELKGGDAKGLCVAFWKQECDKVSSKSCEKKLENYCKVTGGKEMPGMCPQPATGATFNTGPFETLPDGHQNPDCGQTLGGTGTFYLASNLDCSGDGPTIPNGATLDCRGLSIKKNGDRGNSRGVTLNGGATLKNCNVEGFSFGVFFYRQSNVLIENVRASKNFHGFYCGGFSAAEMTNVIAENNSHSGIYSEGQVSITGCKSSGNKYGVILRDYWRNGIESSIENCVIEDNFREGYGLGVSVDGQTVNVSNTKISRSGYANIWTRGYYGGMINLNNVYACDANNLDISLDDYNPPGVVNSVGPVVCDSCDLSIRTFECDECPACP